MWVPLLDARLATLLVLPSAAVLRGLHRKVGRVRHFEAANARALFWAKLLR
jgi:hypothetical protein